VRCSAKISEFRGYCGAYSHWKFQDVPKIMVDMPVERSACEEAWRSGKIKMPDGEIVSITVGTELNYQYLPKGRITVQPHVTSCQGELVRFQRNKVDESLVLTSYKFLITGEEFLMDAEGRVEALHSHEKLPTDCTLDRRGCHSDGVVYLWSTPQNGCPYLLIQPLDLTEEDDRYLDEKKGLEFIVRSPRTVTELQCPPLKLWSTSISQVFITFDSAARLLPMVDSRNIDVSENLKPTITYWANKVQERVEMVETEAKGSSCALLTELKENEDKIYPEAGTGGFARREGMVVHIFTCNLRVAQVASVDRCYFEIPISVHGALQYVNMDTLIATTTPRLRPCEEMFATMVKTVENRWIKITPTPLVVTAPKILEHQDGKKLKLPVSDLFTAAQLEGWRRYSSYPSFSGHTHSRVSYGECLNTLCSNEASSEARPYSIERLQALPKELTEEVLDQLLPWKTAREAWVKFTHAVTIILTMEYIFVIIATCTAIFVYGLKPALGALGARLVLDNSRLIRQRRNHRAQEIYLSDEVIAARKRLTEIAPSNNV